MYLTNTFSLLSQRLSSWFEYFVVNLPNFIISLTILITAFILSRIVKQKTHIPKRFHVPPSVDILFSNILSLVVIVLGVLLALEILNLNQAVTSILAGAGIVGLAIGFALQDIVANFISGLVIISQRPFKIGDLIEVQNHFGLLKKVDLRTITIQTLQGQRVLIPNKEVFANSVINYTQSAARRVDIICGVAYKTDLKLAKQTALEAINKLECVDSSKEIEFFYQEFADSAITFELRFWINFKAEPDFLEARSQSIMAIKKAFDEKAIEIPYPVTTLQVDPEQFKSLIK